MKKKLLIIVGMLLCLGLGMTGAYAYFSAVTSQKDNAISIVGGSQGEAKGKIVESKWDEDNAVNMIPRTVVEKDPKIVSETLYEAYAYLKVSVPQVNAKKGTEKEKTYQDVVVFTPNAGWTLIGETTGTSETPHLFLYRCDTKLAPLGSTGTLFDSITVPDFKAADDASGNVSLWGYMVQTAGVTQSEADGDAITWSGVTALTSAP